MHDLVELVVNGNFIGIFSSKKYAKEWAEKNKPLASYRITMLGTTIPLYLKPANHDSKRPQG